MDSRSKLVLGAHVVIGALFAGLGVLGLLQGAEPAGAGLRVLLGVLVVGLGFAVARLV
jgi:hypothetical protein